MSALKALETAPEDYGPAMLALEERHRKYVRARVWEGLNATQAARRAGYVDGVSAHQIRVTGHRLEHSEKIIAAMREEGDRLLGHAAPLAIAGLVRALDSKSESRRAWAVENVLDRSGYGRKSTQDIRVEHTDNRSTEDLLDAIWRYAEAKRAAAPRLAKPVEHLDTRETLCSTRSDEAEAAGKSGKDKKEQAAWRDGVQPVQEAAAAGRAILPRVPRGVA